jgi:hypothetical protein
VSPHTTKNHAAKAFWSKCGYHGLTQPDLPMPAVKRQPVIIVHRAGREISWSGEEAVQDAFALRDSQALAQALIKHPGCWQTELGLLDRKEDIKQRGTLAHFALRTGWADALPVLFHMVTHSNADLDTGHTPLGTAIVVENEQAFEWLLQQSPGEGESARSPLEALARHAPQLRAPLAIAQKLVDAGHDPWQATHDGQEIPNICLQKDHIQLASFLAKHGHAQGCLFADELTVQWFAILHKGEMDEHHDLLAALRYQGREPSLSFMAHHYREMMIRDDLVGKHYGQISTLEKLIVQRAEMGVDKKDAHYAAETLRSVSEHVPAYWGPTLAMLDHMALGETTDTVPLRRTRHRI